MNIKTGFKEGVYAAYQFGAEYQANPGSSRREYLDNAACYFGKGTFKELNEKEKQACLDAFHAGVIEEKKLQA